MKVLTLYKFVKNVIVQTTYDTYNSFTFVIEKYYLDPYT